MISPAKNTAFQGFSHGCKFALAVGGGLSTVVALVTDVLRPLAAVGIYIFFMLLVVSALCLCLKSVRSTDKWCCDHCTKWFYPLFSTVLFSALLIFAAVIYGDVVNKQQGFMADTFPALQKIQSDLFDIKQATGRIEQKVDTLHGSSERIESKVDSLHKKMDVLQEEPADPRKKLASLGISWSAESYGDQMALGDTEAVRLFYEGKMAPLTKIVGTPMLPLLVNLVHNTPHMDQMLLLAHKYGLDIKQPHLNTGGIANYIHGGGDAEKNMTRSQIFFDWREDIDITQLYIYSTDTINTSVIDAFINMGAQKNALIVTSQKYIQRIERMFCYKIMTSAPLSSLELIALFQDTTLTQRGINAFTKEHVEAGIVNHAKVKDYCTSMRTVLPELQRLIQDRTKLIAYLRRS